MLFNSSLFNSLTFNSVAAATSGLPLPKALVMSSPNTKPRIALVSANDKPILK